MGWYWSHQAFLRTAGAAAAVGQALLFPEPVLACGSLMAGAGASWNLPQPRVPLRGSAAFSRSGVGIQLGRPGTPPAPNGAGGRWGREPLPGDPHPDPGLFRADARGSRAVAAAL